MQALSVILFSMNTHQIEIPEELLLLVKRGEEFIATTEEVDLLQKYFEHHSDYISAYHCEEIKINSGRWKCRVNWKSRVITYDHR